MNLFKKPLAVILAVSLVALPATANAAIKYNDFNAITQHVNFPRSEGIRIAKPSQDIETTADSYYITGESNPNAKLFCNGYEVGGRGIFGSFGVFVDLGYGKNTFTFTQDGSKTKSVTIIRSQDAAPTTSSTSSMEPKFDTGINSGVKMEISCVSPAGADVKANILGASVTLKQAVPAKDGVPATFKGEIVIPNVSAFTNAGSIKYTQTYKGNTKNYYSQGDLYIYPHDQKVFVEVIDPVVPLHPGSDDDTIVHVVRKESSDYVTGYSSDRYKLSNGCWIRKDAVKPVPTAKSSNEIARDGFSKTIYGERYKFKGTAHKMASGSQSESELEITLFNTSGIDSVDVTLSEIFSSAAVKKDGTDTIVTFKMKPGAKLWGHCFEYDDGMTTLYCKYPPPLSNIPGKPLTDIIVALDPGHGGIDEGAIGITGADGATEKDIVYQTAIAVKKRLESLGATVYMTDIQSQGKTSYTYRMEPALVQKADFFISLHCNSVAGNGLKPNGTEVYYFYNRHKGFADVMSSYIAKYNGRKDRGEMFNKFRVSLNPLAPSVLVELGFVSHPREYDYLCNKKDIFDTANAIADGIIAYLK